MTAVKVDTSWVPPYRVSVFHTNLPVFSNAFHNRTAEVARLAELIQALIDDSPQWLAILGRRKIGKTSLLVETARRQANRGVRFVLLDLLASFPVGPEVFRTLALRTVDRVFSPSAGASLERLAARPTDYARALQHATGFDALPPDLRADILELPHRPIDAAFVRMAVDLPELVAQTLDLRMVIAIDEFQEIRGAGGKLGDPIPLLRSAWQHHRRVAYVVSGSARSMLVDMLTSQHSPFFQHFDIFEVGPFSEQDAVKLLTDNAPRDRPIRPDLARLAIQALEGHPFYLQLLGEALTRMEPPYDERDLKETLQSLLFTRTGRLSLYFENEFNKLVGRSTSLAATLDALADRPMRTADLARSVGASTGTTVHYVERLGDAVERTESGAHRIVDPTFALWLQWRRPGGTTVPMKIVGDEAEVVTAEFLSRMGFDLVYQSLRSRGAFDLLATRGAHQLGVQVKRRELPLRFSTSNWTRMKADAKRFGWTWVVVSVSSDGRVAVLDPGRAWVGSEARLGADARIENLLAWVDENPFDKPASA